MTILYIPALDAVVVHDALGVVVYNREKYSLPEYDTHGNEEFLGTFRQIEPQVGVRTVVDFHIATDIRNTGIVMRKSNGIGDIISQPLDAVSHLNWQSCLDHLALIP